MLNFKGSSMVFSGAALLVAACVAQSQDSEGMRGSVRIDGSSTVAPITMAVAEEFREVAPRVRVTVGISGTGGGFKRFTVGETDISNASRPITAKEHAAAKENNVEFIELPIAYDGLSIVVNYKNHWCESLTVDELRKIFLSDSTVETWKDIRPTWPNTQLKLFAPGTDSGTFDYFKEVVAGKTGSIRSDMSVSEDDNVLVRGVSGDEGALGFFGFAYFIENQDQLKAVKIDGGKGPIAPTTETIEDGTYSPLSRPLLIYVNKKSAARPEVKAFIEFYLKESSDLVAEVGYVKLPVEVMNRAASNFAKLRTGTQYLDEKGEKVSGPLSKVYQ